MATSINKIFGENLYKFRKMKGLTQEQLGFEVELEKSTIAKYENGTRCPSLKMAQMLADVLGIKLSQMIE